MRAEPGVLYCLEAEELRKKLQLVRKEENQDSMVSWKKYIDKNGVITLSDDVDRSSKMASETCPLGLATRKLLVTSNNSHSGGAVDLKPK